jgi:hypothetical protein
MTRRQACLIYVDSLHHLESFPVFSFNLEMLGQPFPLMSCVVVMTQREFQSFIFESQKFNCFFRLAMRDNRLLPRYNLRQYD